MDEKFIQSDHDLYQVLENIKRDELGVLVMILREASSCWLEKSCRDILKIADELQRLGGVSGLNTLRGHGVKYREIVTDVASKIGTKIKNANDIAEMEWQIVLATINKVKGKLNNLKKAQFELEFREIISSDFSDDIWDIIDRNYLSNNERLKITKIVKSIVFDKRYLGNGFISSIFNKTLFATGVAYKATIPAVFFIAEARLKMKCRLNNNYSKERPKTNVEGPNKKLIYEKIQNEEVDSRVPEFYEDENINEQDIVVKEISNEDKRLMEVKRKSKYLRLNGPIHKIEDILKNNIKVPKAKGIYAWYFNELPPYIPAKKYIKIDGWTLLYVGIAGDTPESSATLHSRIKGMHLGNGGESSLRDSLGALLTKKLAIRPTKRGDSTRFMDEDGEKLTDWLRSHAQLNFLTDSFPWEVEDHILADYGHLLPLNSSKNKNNGFRKELKKIKADCKSNAMS